MIVVFVIATVHAPLSHAARSLAMAWRLRSKLRKAPPGADVIADALEDFEAQMRAATSAPRGAMMNAQLTWPVHKLHFQKNRFLHDARYVLGTISDALLKFLVREKIADGPLLAKWRKPGYDSVCSMSVLDRGGTNFGTVGICRTPLKDRHGQIVPNVQTGCVCCVSGSGGPIWWDDPVPEAVKQQILGIDPGKKHLFDEAEAGGKGDDEEEEGFILEGQGVKLLRGTVGGGEEAGEDDGGDGERQAEGDEAGMGPGVIYLSNEGTEDDRVKDGASGGDGAGGAGCVGPSSESVGDEAKSRGERNVSEGASDDLQKDMTRDVGREPALGDEVAKNNDSSLVRERVDQESQTGDPVPSSPQTRGRDERRSSGEDVKDGDEPPSKKARGVGNS